MQTAINIESSRTKVKVALLDSGVDWTDEIGVKERINLIPEEQDVVVPLEDTTGHGTGIAGIIAAKDNGEGITGINPNVELYSARILNDNNQATLSRVVEGIYWAIEQDVNIISMSFGTTQNTEVLHKAIKDAHDAGNLIVASAGNNGGAVEYPAAYPEVMAVGSVDADGVLSETSAKGRQLEIVAPGEYVKTTGSFSGELVTSGTSISVPHVVGAASVLWEKDLNCSNEFIRDLLVASSNKSNDESTANNGIVDLEYALSVYDEFKKNYKKNADMEEVIEENTHDLETEGVEVVEARWSIPLHADLAVTTGDAYKLTNTQVKILKRGIKYPDQQFSHTVLNPQWHTSALPNYPYDNYISSYRCATLIARAIKNGKKISSVKKPKGMSQANYDRMISQIQNIPWSTALGGAAVTNNNKALFVIGMAMHTVSDTYAHQAYVLKNGVWTLLMHPECDQSDVYPKRFKLAAEATDTVLGSYLAGFTGDHIEYTTHFDGTSFRLHKLVQYMKEQETYEESTFGDMPKMMRGSIMDE